MYVRILANDIYTNVVFSIVTDISVLIMELCPDRGGVLIVEVS